LVDLSREAVRRKPLRLGVRIEEGAIDSLRGGAKDAVKSDGIRHFGSPWCWYSLVERVHAESTRPDARSGRIRSLRARRRDGRLVGMIEAPLPRRDSRNDSRLEDVSAEALPSAQGPLHAELSPILGRRDKTPPLAPAAACHRGGPGPAASP